MLTNAILLIVAFSLIGFVITIILGLLRNVGLDFIVDTALQMILYDRKTHFRNHIIWNKLWLRFGVLAFAVAASGTFISLLLKPLIPNAFFSSAWFYLSVVILFAYGYWIRKTVFWN